MSVSSGIRTDDAERRLVGRVEYLPPGRWKAWVLRDGVERPVGIFPNALEARPAIYAIASKPGTPDLASASAQSFETSATPGTTANQTGVAAQSNHSEQGDPT